MSPKKERRELMRLPAVAEAPPAPARLQEVREATTRRILDGAVRVLGRSGYRKATMEEVAREARLTRMTVYRYFPSRDDLMRALIGREMTAYYRELLSLAEQEEREARPGSNPASKILADGFLFTQHYLARHELLQTLLDKDPEILLPYWTTKAEAYFRIAVPSLAPVLKRWIGKGWIRRIDPAATAEWLTRLAMSWFISPGVAGDPHVEKVLRKLVSELVWPALRPTEK